MFNTLKLGLFSLNKGFQINQLEVSEKGSCEDAFTRDGSVDRYGKPAVKWSTGGWRCGMFLLGKYMLFTLSLILFIVVDYCFSFSIVLLL